jgi:hypothetical protein
MWWLLRNQTVLIFNSSHRFFKALHFKPLIGLLHRLTPSFTRVMLLPRFVVVSS